MNVSSSSRAEPFSGAGAGGAASSSPESSAGAPPVSDWRRSRPRVARTSSKGASPSIRPDSASCCTVDLARTSDGTSAPGGSDDAVSERSARGVPLALSSSRRRLLEPSEKVEAIRVRKSARFVCFGCTEIERMSPFAPSSISAFTQSRLSFSLSPATMYLLWPSACCVVFTRNA